MSHQPVKVGDVALLPKQSGIGIVRYIGEVEFDKGVVYFGIELKGPPTAGGNDGSWDGRQYFKAKPGRGLFVRKIGRIITSEELLEKVAYVHDELKRSRKNTHYVDRSSYDELDRQNDLLRSEVATCRAKIETMNEQLRLLRQDATKKFSEYAVLQGRVTKTERRVGKRLSQIDAPDPFADFEHDASVVASENTGNGYEPPALVGDEKYELNHMSTVKIVDDEDLYEEISRKHTAEKDDGYTSGDERGYVPLTDFSDSTRANVHPPRAARQTLDELEALGDWQTLSKELDPNGNMTDDKTPGHRSRNSRDSDVGPIYSVLQ